MTTVSQTPAQVPNLLGMVNRVMRECGIEAQSTITGTVFRPALVAVDALNDAVQEIFQRNRWEWANTLANIRLNPNQSDYVLPADFMRTSSPVAYNGQQLVEYTPTEFAWKTTNVWSTLANGSPQYFTCDNQTLRIWPSPVQATIDVQPYMQLFYFQKPPGRMIADTDAMNIPYVFLEAIVSFANWKVKTLLEYPDAGDAFQRYERCLAVQMNADKSTRKQAKMRMRGPNIGRVWI